MLQVIAPEKAGGMGFEPAACTAGAALCDEVARGLAGRDGEPARLALESNIAQTCHRLGYEPSEACPTPLEWFPKHLSRTCPRSTSARRGCCIGCARTSAADIAAPSRRGRWHARRGGSTAGARPRRS